MCPSTKKMRPFFKPRAVYFLSSALRQLCPPKCPAKCNIPANMIYNSWPSTKVKMQLFLHWMHRQQPIKIELPFSLMVQSLSFSLKLNDDRILKSRNPSLFMISWASVSSLLVECPLNIGSWSGNLSHASCTNVSHVNHFTGPVIFSPLQTKHWVFLQYVVSLSLVLTWKCDWPSPRTACMPTWILFSQLTLEPSYEELGAENCLQMNIT